MAKRDNPSPLSGAAPNRWFFDVWSRIYDFPLVQRTTYRPVHDAVVEHLRTKAVRRILDVGCGTGQLSVRIKSVFPQMRVVGCDFSGGMLSHAAMRSQAVSWVRADAARLPFADRTFDAVISTEAFHWFPDQDSALAEFYRVLTPGGRLLLALVNTPTAVLSGAMYVGSRLVGAPFYWPTRGRLRRQAEAAGFHVHAQHRIFRLPGFLLPPVLTDATRPARARKGQSP